MTTATNASKPIPGTQVSTGMSLSGRLAGAGGIAFVVIVIAQNVIRGAIAPANNAATSVVMQHYVDNHALESVLSATFAVSGFALMVFLGGLLARITSGPGRAWSFVGLIGAAGIIALFSTVVAVEIALSTVAEQASPTASAVQTLWVLHNSVFSILDLSIAAALLGLGLASVSAGVAPRVFRWLAPTGAVLLGIGAGASPVIVDGSAMPVMGLPLIGFVIWLAFVAATGARLIRAD